MLPFEGDFTSQVSLMLVSPVTYPSGTRGGLSSYNKKTNTNSIGDQTRGLVHCLTPCFSAFFDINLCVTLMRYYWVRLPKPMPWENGWAVPNHSYRICNVELSLKGVWKTPPRQVSHMTCWRGLTRRNSCDHFADTAAILISIVSNSYYGMLKEQIHINLSPKHPMMFLETIEIKMVA